MVGSGVGASLGVLIKGGSALETTHSVQVVVFDKTGTLTHGKPAVTSVQVFEHPEDMFPISIDSKEKLLLVAGSCEAPSEHPLARAVVAAATDACGEVELCEVDSFESTVGSGVGCCLKQAWAQLQLLQSVEQSVTSVGDKTEPLEVFIGSRSFVKSVGDCAPNTDQDSAAKVLEEEGQTIVFVMLKQGSGPYHLAGFIAIADSLREEAKTTIEQLHLIGIEVWMASGDNKR